MFENKTYDNILIDMLNRVLDRNPDIDISVGSMYTRHSHPLLWN
jgi:uncharacterized phage protein gp47/JayE